MAKSLHVSIHWHAFSLYLRPKGSARIARSRVRLLRAATYPIAIPLIFRLLGETCDARLLHVGNDIDSGRVFRLEHEVISRLRNLSATSLDKNAVQNALELLAKYDELSACVYRIRSEPTVQPEDRKKIEDSFSSISQELMRHKVTLQPKESQFLKKYRRIWKRDFPMFVACAIFFGVSILVGAVFGTSRTEYASVLMPQDLMESILEKKAWFYSHDDGSGLELSAEIAFNNIIVCTKLFVFGAFLGIGGLLLLCYNGIFIGAVFGYCYINGFHEQLRSFVLGHGFLELSIVVVSAFASLQYGRAFVTIPYAGFLTRLINGVRNGATIMLGAVPWLILAGAVEGIFSTISVIDVKVKLSVGVFIATLFWIWSLKGCFEKDA